MAAPGWVMDIGKARSMMGFEAGTGLEDGLSDTLNWYKEKGLL